MFEECTFLVLPFNILIHELGEFRFAINQGRGRANRLALPLRRRRVDGECDRKISRIAGPRGAVGRGCPTGGGRAFFMAGDLGKDVAEYSGGGSRLDNPFR